MHPIHIHRNTAHGSIKLTFGLAYLSRDRINPRASFHAVEDLAYRWTHYVDDYHRLLAKPFRWTYNGRLL
ncbi:hypothetical protein [Salicibibacter kimchii]|uniref:Uncharacterized protein n=1 Tax=Salicibibacter kimchii TaxID=2099786 RepID=A0A345C139_9BACI|nr:hypothetical protein [Salicibibacter kimchii]AXF56920.1 hypothetical protein DT065_13520 [Salicibibacter kimchii]